MRFLNQQPISGASEEIQSEKRGGEPVVGAEFVVDRAEVKLHGREFDLQEQRHFRVGLALGKPCENFGLAAVKSRDRRIATGLAVRPYRPG